MRRSLSLLLRPSTLLSGVWLGFWIFVAALHLGLFAARLRRGEWTAGPDQVRLVLALAGALYGIYGTFKIGSLARIIGDSPRKALAVALLLTLGHFALSPSAAATVAERALSGKAAAQVIVVLPAVVAAALLGAAAILASAPRRRSVRIRFSFGARAPSVDSAPLPRGFSLFQRPPPFRL